MIFETQEDDSMNVICATLTNIKGKEINKAYIFLIIDEYVKNQLSAKHIKLDNDTIIHNLFFQTNTENLLCEINDSSELTV